MESVFVCTLLCFCTDLVALVAFGTHVIESYGFNADEAGGQKAEYAFQTNPFKTWTGVASAPNSGLLVASCSAMFLAVDSDLGAACGYRSVAMAPGGSSRSAKKVSKLQYILLRYLSSCCDLGLLGYNCCCVESRLCQR